MKTRATAALHRRWPHEAQWVAFALYSTIRSDTTTEIQRAPWSSKLLRVRRAEQATPHRSYTCSAIYAAITTVLRLLNVPDATCRYSTHQTHGCQAQCQALSTKHTRTADISTRSNRAATDTQPLPSR